MSHDLVSVASVAEHIAVWMPELSSNLNPARRTRSNGPPSTTHADRSPASSTHPGRGGIVVTLATRADDSLDRWPNIIEVRVRSTADSRSRRREHAA